MFHQVNLDIRTSGRGTHEITGEIESAIRASGIKIGLCHIFVAHTSASLVVCENADPQVRRDLEAFLERLVPDGDALFRHTAEGPDDMPAHIRSILTQSAITIPIREGRSALGTWQGIFLYEHRYHAHLRHITITAYG